MKHSLMLILLMFTLLNFGCGKTQKTNETQGTSAKTTINPTEPRILKSINHSEGIFSAYEYDSQKRLTKMTMTNYDIYGEINNGEPIESFTTITYNSDDMISVESDNSYYGPATFHKKGNIITVKTSNTALITTLTLDNDGNITKKEQTFDDQSEYHSEETFQYVNGNMVKLTVTNTWDTTIIECKFDNKKSIYNCNTPRWLLQYLYGVKPNTDITGVDPNNIIEVKQDDNITTYTYEYDEYGYPINVEYTGYLSGVRGYEYF